MKFIQKTRNIFAMATLMLLMASCGEYVRVQKNPDPNVKFEYAQRAFEQKKYQQAATILKDCVTQFKGTERAEEALYLLAMSYYENHDYVNSGAWFQTYYNRYPKGKYAEPSRFFCGYGYYLDSPDSQLDQSGTVKAIEELQAFLDNFPRSEKVSIAQNAIFEMQDKLTFKELENAQLYYDLGNYMGNNYESAVIVARNAIKNYPYSKYKEDLEWLILRARFAEAENSIYERKADRYGEVVDEYYSFINNFPDSPHRKEADSIFKTAQKYVHD